jgi:6-phosphogluconolactonase
MGDFDLISFASDDELARAAAVAWLKEVESANRIGAAHCVALSGGRIVRKFFGTVTEQAEAGAVAFKRIQFFWADERCVLPDDRESNFRLARERLLAPLKIADAQIHRVRGEAPADLAAAEAEAEICCIAPQNPVGQPVLDLIFLGMGEDGHVASLFPGEPEEIVSSTSVYRAVVATKPPARRITLGYAAIAAARQVWVLASGPGKEAALRESLRPGGQTPLARMLRLRDYTRVFSDIQPV